MALLVRGVMGGFSLACIALVAVGAYGLFVGSVAPALPTMGKIVGGAFAVGFLYGLFGSKGT